MTPENYDFDEGGTTADQNVTQWDSDRLEHGKRPIGIPDLDDELGGVPPGSVVGLVMEPRGVGDMIAYHVASTAPTSYITTTRRETVIKREFERFGPTDGVPPYTKIKSTRRGNDKSKDQIQSILRRQDGVKNYVIDTINGASKDNMEEIMSQISVNMQEKDGIALVIFVQDPNEKMSKEIKNSLYFCDVVMSNYHEIETTNDSISHILEITRLRGNRNKVPENTYQLEVSDCCALDGQSTANV